MVRATDVSSPPGAAGRRVLVAGAGGLLGRLVIGELVRRGAFVRAIVRRPATFAGPRIDVRRLDGLQRGAWTGQCDGVDAVVSCIGASVNPSLLVGWRSYTSVDAPANLGLLAEAERAGVRRFVYVSLVGGDAALPLNYAEGHERVVDGLRHCSVAATVLRPTGFFAAMAEFLPLARRGVVPVFGDGLCMTNPIHETDVALAAADAIADEGGGVREVGLGGPEEFTRRDIARLAFEVQGRKPRLMHLSPGLMSTAGRALGLVNPRAGHFLQFAVNVMTHPCIAPRVGKRRMEDYFVEAAGRQRKT